MKIKDHSSCSVLILIVFSTTLGAGTVSQSQEEKRIYVGTGGLIDGFHVVYGEDLKAVWNATSFSMYDNGTVKFDMTLRYLSTNPTTSMVYRSTTGNYYPVETNGDLRYISSIALLKVRGEYYSSQFGTGSSPSLSEVIPVYTVKVDNQTSLASFKASYNTSSEYFSPLPPNIVQRSYEVNLSWVRVFEDSEGRKYYQWMQGSSPSAYDSSGQRLRLNQEYNSLSGSFGVYMPIPENMTAPLPESVTGTHQVEYDYVKWIAENTNDDDTSDQASTEFEATDSYWIIGSSIYWIIGGGIAALGVIIGAIIGSIIGFRRWRKKS